MCPGSDISVCRSVFTWKACRASQRSDRRHRPHFSAFLPPSTPRRVPAPKACPARPEALHLRRPRNRTAAVGPVLHSFGAARSAHGDRCKAIRWLRISSDRSVPELDGCCRIRGISMSDARIQGGRELHVGRQREPRTGDSGDARPRVALKSIVGIPTCCLLWFKREHNTLSRR